MAKKDRIKKPKVIKEGAPAKSKVKIDKTINAALGIEDEQPKSKNEAKKERRINRQIRKETGEPKPPRTDFQLTNQLAQHIAIMWTHNLTDEVIFTSLGIPKITFYSWLKQNRLVTVKLRLGEEYSNITLGMRELKERMKAIFEPGYLMRLESVVDKSEDAGDYRTASSNLRWLMAKRLPKKYGREADTRIGSDQIEAICNSIFTIIFKHVKDPEILSKIQDDLDRMKLEEEQKLESSLNNSQPEASETEINIDNEPELEIDSADKSI